MMNYMYYDVFDGKYVAEADESSVPERFIKVYRGEDKYIDSWKVSKNGVKDIIDISYEREEYYDCKIHDQRLIDTCKINGFKPIILDHFTLPFDKFDKYVERFGLIER